MGISHPYLAILSAIAFIIVVTSISLLYLYIIDQANKTPILGVYAEAFVDPLTGEVTVSITIRHERGKPVEITRIQLFNETSAVVIDNFTNSEHVMLLGCINTLIPPGGTCRVSLRFPREIFEENKTYRGVVFFSEGTYPVAFTPIKQAILQPPQISACSTLRNTTRFITELLYFTSLEGNLAEWSSGDLRYDNETLKLSYLKRDIYSALLSGKRLWVSTKIYGLPISARKGVILAGFSETSLESTQLSEIYEFSIKENTALIRKLEIRGELASSSAILSSAYIYNFNSREWYTIVVNVLRSESDGEMHFHMWVYDKSGILVASLQANVSTQIQNWYIGVCIGEVGVEDRALPHPLANFIALISDPGLTPDFDSMEFIVCLQSVIG